MQLKDIKQQFFALRNGLLADTLRKQASLPYKLIFGLNIIQLREIAAGIGRDKELSAALWADSECRESRLLASMIAPAPELSRLDEVRTPEEADILCHASLRHHPDALSAAIKATKSPEPLIRYAGLRLLLNLLPAAVEDARSILPTLPEHPLTLGIAAQLSQTLSDL